MKTLLAGLFFAFMAGNAFAAPGYECVADGYNRFDRLVEVVGTCERDRRYAEDSALDECDYRGLSDCALVRSSCERCDTRDSRPTDPRPRPRPQPGPAYVVGYQHVKGQCFGNDYIKVQQQCGGRGMWHGIYCKVEYSDGTSKDFHGQVDFDVNGVRVCERSARPANFNCVSSCDNTPGPFVRR